MREAARAQTVRAGNFPASTAGGVRVLFLTLYPAAAASPRYRVHQYLPALAAAGLNCTVACAVAEDFWTAWQAAPRRRGGAWRYHLHEALRCREQLRTLSQHDRIVVQKGLTSAPVRGLAGALAERQADLYYDIDDAVHRFSPDHLPRPLRVLESNEPQGRSLMGLARKTLAGNRWLETETREAGGRPVYFPTVVDTAHFTPRPQPDDVYRLGWMGSPSTTAHLERLAPVLADFRDGEILVVGAGRRLSFAAEQKAWSLESEREDMARMSIGLMPLPDDTWSQGKCGLKALLCMAMGRPVIASPVGAAREIIEHGVSGLLADSDAEWRAAMERLRDPVERRKMGEAARARVEERYSLSGWAPKLAQLLGECA